ncbi:hypothetical protein [Streptomyces sp. NPDC051561]|uniref:hypothetical protein n=1 Tax=Streptomyces sp. NPDC051561 TaxID=3365658 RepID=UPI0037884DD8
MKTLMRTSVMAFGLTATALLAAVPAHADSTDTPHSAPLTAPTEMGGADEMVDKAADLTLSTLVGEANNEEDGLVGSVLPGKGNGHGLGLDVSGMNR